MSQPDVDRMMQEREIVDLTIRYAWAIDHRRFEDLDSVFAPDATADYGRLGVLRGSEAIAEAVAGALARFDRTQHIVANHQVNVDGDRAWGRCYFQAQHVLKEGGAERNHIVAGNYVDAFRRTGDGWRIVERALRVTWTEPAEPVGRRPASGRSAGGPAPLASDTSFVIAGWIDIDPEQVGGLLEAAVVMMAETRKEPGNLEYCFSADPAVAGRIRVFERWRSEGDLRGHFDAPHMTVFQQALGRAGVRGRDLARFHVHGVGPVFDVRPSDAGATAR